MKPAASAQLTAQRPPWSDREASIQFGMNVYRVIGSPGYPTPEPELRAKVERAFDRSYYPIGVARQMVAILASGSRVDLLRTIRLPTLVLHGEDDPLIPVEGGKDTARLVPRSALKTIPGWGHDVPTALIPTLVEAIATHCQNADCVTTPGSRPARQSGLRRQGLAETHVARLGSISDAYDKMRARFSLPRKAWRIRPGMWNMTP